VVSIARQTGTAMPMEKLENSDLTDQNRDPPLNFKPFSFCVGSRQMALLPKTYTYLIIFFHIFVKKLHEDTDITGGNT